MPHGVEQRPWTVGEDNTVKAGHAEQWTDEEIGEMLGRPALAVSSRRMHLGLVRSNCAWWRLDGNLEKIRAFADAGWTVSEVADHFGSNRSSIYLAAEFGGFKFKARKKEPKFQPQRKETPQTAMAGGRPIFARYKANVFAADEDEAPITLEQLQRTPSACAWPYDSAAGGEVVYCGLPGTRRAPSRSCYCPEHDAVAYAPSKPRERQHVAG